MNHTPSPLPSQTLVDDQNPWPGLVSFTEAASAYFCGRDEERFELFRLVTRETLSVVFGQSGLGKTSLLQAGLFPDLRRADYLPVYVRLSYGPDSAALAAQILQALLEAAARAKVSLRPPGPADTLWEYFQHRESVCTGPARRPVIPVLVLDQFEEIFTLGRARMDLGRGLVEELECLVENRAPPAVQARFEQAPDEMDHYDFERRAFKLVLSLREDHLAELENFRNRLRGLAQNRFRLQRMDDRQGLAVALEAGRGLISEAAARLVVENLGSGAGEGPAELGRRFIEPALLSVVLRELNFRRQREGAAQITPTMVTVANDILRDFYHDKLSDVPDGSRATLEDALLSDTGRYRVQVARDDLVVQGVPAGLLDRLVERRILRYDERYGARVVELSHDRLMPVVQESRAARRERVAREEAAQGSEEWLILARDEMGLPVKTLRRQVERAADAFVRMRIRSRNLPGLHRNYLDFLATAMETLYLHGEIAAGDRCADRARELPGDASDAPPAERKLLEARVDYATGLGAILRGDFAGACTNLDRALVVFTEQAGAPGVPRLHGWATLARAEADAALLAHEDAIKRVETLLGALDKPGFGLEGSDAVLVPVKARLLLAKWTSKTRLDGAWKRATEAQKQIEVFTRDHPESLLGKQLLVEAREIGAQIAVEEARYELASFEIDRALGKLGELTRADAGHSTWRLLRARCLHTRFHIDDAMRSNPGPTTLDVSLNAALAECREVLRFQPDHHAALMLSAHSLTTLSFNTDRRYNAEWSKKNAAGQLQREEQYLKDAGAQLARAADRAGAVSAASLEKAKHHRQYAAFLCRREKYDEARRQIAAVDQAVAAARTGGVQSPELVDAELDYYDSLGRLENEQKHHRPEAAAAYAQFLSIADAAIKRWPQSPTWARYARYGAYCAAEIDRKTDDYTEALAGHTRNRDLTQADADRWPQNRKLWESLAWESLARSLVLAKMDQKEAEAVAAYADACEILARIQRRYPTDSRLKSLLAYFQSKNAQPNLPAFEARSETDPALKARLAHARAKPKPWGAQPGGGFSLLPIIPGDAWRELPANERDQVVKDASLHLHGGKRKEPQSDPAITKSTDLESWLDKKDEILAIRSLPLVCYPDTTLYEASVRAPDGGLAILTFLQQLRAEGSTFLHLNGKASGIHAFNAKAQLKLETREQVEQYLRLFCAAIDGGEGTFRILDTIEQVYVFDVPLARHPEDLRASIKAPQLTGPDDSGRWRMTASLVYGNALFDATLEIKAEDLSVTMIEDNPIAADLPILSERFDAVTGLRCTPAVERQRRSVASSLLIEAQRFEEAAALLEEGGANDDGTDQAALAMKWIKLRDYTRALNLAESILSAMDSDKSREGSSALRFHLIKAHALLFLNQPDEALAIYTNASWLEQKVGTGQNAKTWEQRIKDDFGEFEKTSLTHLDFGKIIELVQDGIAAKQRERAALLSEIGDAHAKAEELYAAQRYKEAVEQQEKVLQSCIETNSKFGNTDTENHLKGNWLSLTRYQLFARDFDAALKSSEMAGNDYPDYLRLKTSHAHALLHLDRTKEAEAIYLRYRGRTLAEQDNALWEDIIRDDFRQMTAAGVTHPDYARIEHLLSAETPPHGNQ